MPQLHTEDGSPILTESGDPILLETTALLTEDGQPLETEDGQPIVAESSSGTGESGSGTGESGIIPARGTATLSLDAGIGGGGLVVLETSIFIEAQGTATLHLDALDAAPAAVELEPTTETAGTAPLALEADSNPNIARSVNPNVATLLMIAQRRIQGLPPSGLGARMIVTHDPHDRAHIIDQYLQVWFDAPPSIIELQLQIDAGPWETMNDGAWENPGELPAVIRFAGASIPGDGLTHRLTVAARALIDGEPSGPAAQAVITARTPNNRVTTPVHWVAATPILQTTAETPDVTEVRWRHAGAVRIVARYLTRRGNKWTWTIATVGYADYDEERIFIEDLASRVHYSGAWNQLLALTASNVKFGVSAIAKNQFGPVAWAEPTVPIIGRNPRPPAPPAPNPDAAARTDGRLENNQFLGQVSNAVKNRYLLNSDPLALHSQYSNVIHWAIRHAFRRIKDIVRQGGSVTVDDFGRFEATWNPQRTERSQRFTAGPGYQHGTRRGLILKDDEISPE